MGWGARTERVGDAENNLKKCSEDAMECAEESSLKSLAYLCLQLLDGNGFSGINFVRERLVGVRLAYRSLYE